MVLSVYQRLLTYDSQVGGKAGAPYQSTTIDFFWPSFNRTSLAGLCQLCSNRASHEVCADVSLGSLKCSFANDTFRLAHRLREMQTLPYVVVANPHISLVYELYYKAFERFRTIPAIKSLDDNNRYCDVLREMLKEHLTVIPNLAMGVLECQGLVNPNEIDRFLNTMLRAVCMTHMLDFETCLT